MAGCTVMSGGVLPNIHAVFFPKKRPGKGGNASVGDKEEEEEEEEESSNWVGDNEDEDCDEEEYQEALDEYQDLLVAASKSEEPCETMLCYDKEEHRDSPRLPEGALTPETLDTVLVEKFGEAKERIAAAQQKRQEKKAARKQGGRRQSGRAPGVCSGVDGQHDRGRGLPQGGGRVSSF